MARACVPFHRVVSVGERGVAPEGEGADPVRLEEELAWEGRFARPKEEFETGVVGSCGSWWGWLQWAGRGMGAPIRARAEGKLQRVSVSTTGWSTWRQADGQADHHQTSVKSLDTENRWTVSGRIQDAPGRQ